MNPISLLTKGRTILGLKERPGLYKLLGDGALPKFGGPKSPIPTTSHPAPEKVQSALFELPKPEPEARQEAAKTEITKKSPFSKITADKAAHDKQPEKPKPAQPKQPVTSFLAPGQTSKPAFLSRWVAILVEWAQQWRPWRKAPPFPAPVVQTELALEKVKVLRNDLSEDDLEVVMLENKMGKKLEKPERKEKPEREKLTASP